MAAGYLEALRAIQPSGPFRLMGYSFGGVVAFEMSQRLREMGEETVFLGLLDTLFPAGQGWDLGAPAQQLAGIFFEDPGLFSEAWVGLSDAEQLRLVLEKAREARLCPEGFTVAEAERFLGVFRKHAQAFAAYRPRPYGGEIWLFDAAGAAGGREAEPESPWAEVAKKGLTRIAIPGDHRSLLRPPQVQVLARKLEEILGGH
jgi:thioesterase domain-containing protein